MTHSGTRVALLLALTFAAGAAAGVAVDRYVVERARSPDPQHPEGPRSTTIERFADELGLTEEQRARIKPIVAETRGQMASVFDRVRPEYEAVVDSARSRIEAVLEPDQVSRYRELLAQQRSRHGSE